MNQLKKDIIRVALWLTPQRYLCAMLILIAAFTPQLAMAAWYDPLVSAMKDAKTGFIIILGGISILSILYSGACLLIARVLGTMETNIFDYGKQALIIGIVGGAVTLATWSYSWWGGSISI
ncbi:hypothetical protein [Rahnella perminowiae]|uniref:hypothetical protein n=1 Tax=Rahnella perminowiae TaxID=2816244 RepID=UPI00215CC916|nr:hypothetical protein [Rahnella perminowiae]MCR8998737.1 hypothetical protein [Rahnella perminowiae]